MSYLYCYRGHPFDSRPFQHVNDEKKTQNTYKGLSSGCYPSEWCLPDGGNQWLLVKPWISSFRQCRWYCTGEPPGPSKWPAKEGVFSSSFFACRPGSRRGDTEQVASQWQLPEASHSPGHAGGDELILLRTASYSTRREWNVFSLIRKKTQISSPASSSLWQN